ncbi:glycosyltransferase family 4 protein [Nostoc sp. 106C]|uniref:glycosyltransferase family 4 protein n=1 Tax=Nostoc sp. 106C TaxID=1932667 RepID=UPI000A369391|nr:glycosyltransferase family 4 protein [Nostoc sp. 106C]OUL28827.1 group 1 glycosyl transferase [Nostoc sp. 106C]
MAKILFICAHAPTEIYPQAGQKIALRHLKNYISTGVNVDVLVIANQIEITTATDLFSLVGINVYTYPIKRINKIISCLSHFYVPFKFATRWQNAVLEKLLELLQNNHYDVIHFEYSHAAVYFEYVKQLISLQSTKTIISIHDIIFQSFLRKAENNLLFGIEAARLFSYERTLYYSVNELWVLSKKDRDILNSLFSIPEAKIFIKPPKISSFVYQVQRHPAKIEKKSLLFWAAMNRPENEQAILIFINKCFRPLQQQDPKFKLYIVGASPSKKVLALASQQIMIAGFVENPTPYFEKAEVGIVPLLQGAGIKLKTLEMLEAGLPVIATTVGSEGVDAIDKNLLVNDNFDEWLSLLRNSELWKQN